MKLVLNRKLYSFLLLLTLVSGVPNSRSAEILDTVIFEGLLIIDKANENPYIAIIPAHEKARVKTHYKSYKTFYNWSVKQERWIFLELLDALAILEPDTSFICDYIGTAEYQYLIQGLTVFRNNNKYISVAFITTKLIKMLVTKEEIQKRFGNYLYWINLKEDDQYIVYTLPFCYIH